MLHVQLDRDEAAYVAGELISLQISLAGRNGSDVQ
jgi:hypothetical protein